jgi:hypothetical protein
MTTFINHIVIKVFNLIAFLKGFRFKEVTTDKELKDFELAYNEDGFHLPGELHEMNQVYKTGSISFIAYYKGQPVGTARLGNPKVKNRPFELFGLDKEGEHFEIQNLMVKREFRDGAHFVMLGLFKTMYVYSIKNSVASWISGSTRSVYQTMRRYNKEIKILEKKCQHIDHPLTNYVYANNIVDFYYSMNVTDFSPASIFKKFIRHFSKQVSFLPALARIK